MYDQAEAENKRLTQLNAVTQRELQISDEEKEDMLKNIDINSIQHQILQLIQEKTSLEEKAKYMKEEIDHAKQEELNAINDHQICVIKLKLFVQLGENTCCH